MSEAKLISIKEAAKLLNVTTLTLRNWDKNRKLVPLRHPINNYRVYRREDIDKLIAQISENTRPYDHRKKKVSRKLEIRHEK